MLLLHKEPKKMEKLVYPAFESATLRFNKAKTIYFFKEKTAISWRKRINRKLEDLKTQTIKLKNISLTVSDKITFVIIIWTLILFVITASTRIETFYILIFLSLIVTKELSNPFATDHLKKRINIFIIVFLAAYAFIIITKII